MGWLCRKRKGERTLRRFPCLSHFLKRHEHRLLMLGAPRPALASIAYSEIPPDAIAIRLVGLPIVPFQEVLFAQNLAMEQACGRSEINQAYPIREYQKFAEEDHCKCHINGIAAESKNTVHDEHVGMISVYADPEALPEGNQTP